jgi:hypothetical protein
MPDIFPFSYPAQKRFLLIKKGQGTRGHDTTTPFGIVCSAGNSLSEQCKQVYKVAILSLYSPTSCCCTQQSPTEVEPFILFTNPLGHARQTVWRIAGW